MALPEVHLHNCQDEVSLDLVRLEACTASALPLVLENPGPDSAVLRELGEVEVSFVSDHAIGEVHGQFLNDPSPTDVITFHHGEILVSAETAAAASSSWGHGTDRETMLYIIHGLLHLNGHEDHTEGGAARMRKCQEEILDSVWPHPAARN